MKIASFLRYPSKCEHDLGEQETACADGMCPLCLSRTLTQLKQDIQSVIDTKYISSLTLKETLNKILKEI